MFAVQKLIGGWLMPLPLLLTFILIALIGYRYSRFRRSAGVLFCCSFITLILLSLNPIASRLSATLEYQYPSYQGQRTDFIHVLGNGHSSNSQLPITSQLTAASLARTVEGVRIFKLNPAAKIIFSGYGAGDVNSNAWMNSRLAIALGVPESAIILLPKARNTVEEAIDSKEIVNDGKLVLVTSASHMPRAMRIFQQQGLNPISAPTAHISKSQQGPQPLTYYLPRAQFLAVSERVAHEWLGMVWLLLKNNQ